jgi:hypothetical protein
MTIYQARFCNEKYYIMFREYIVTTRQVDY